MLWTVVAIILGGGDRGGGLPLPPYGSHARRTNRAVIPRLPNQGGFHGKC